MHSPDGIHPRSWQPWKQGMCRWVKWLFGAVDAVGFDHHRSFWYAGTSRKSCPSCLEAHNISVHWCVGFCSEEHPLVQGWIQSWHPHESLARQWRNSASRRERFLIGKLVLPQSLVAVFCNKVGFLHMLLCGDKLVVRWVGRRQKGSFRSIKRWWLIRWMMS